MPKIAWKPATLLAPVPAVLVTCGNLEKPNLFTVAWTGIINSIPPMTYISVRPERHSYSLIRESGEFALNLTTRSLCRATDFCGVRSGRDMDKFKQMDLHIEPAQKISAPLLAESPLSLECRVTEIKELGSHHMFLAEIVAINVEENLIDKSGKLELSKADLLAYAHGEYLNLGDKLGTFGYSVRKKRPARHFKPGAYSKKASKNKSSR